MTEKIDFTNVEEIANDCWLFLTNDKIPNKAEINKEAFLHEVKAILITAIETAKTSQSPAPVEGVKSAEEILRHVHDIYLDKHPGQKLFDFFHSYFSKELAIIKIAFEQYAQQFKQVEGIVWVKGEPSEEIQEKQTKFNIKFQGDPDVMYKLGNDWCFDGEDGKPIIFDGDCNDIEWLYEPTKEDKQIILPNGNQC